MSKYIDIFEQNADFFDRFNNSEELVTVDRFERERKTLAGIERDVQSAIDKLPTQDNVATQDYVQEALESYATKDQLAGYYTIESAKELEEKVDSIDLSPYAFAVDLREAEEKLGSEIKEKADIVYVDQEISKIEIPALDDYATEQYVDNSIADIDLSSYALKSDLSGYLTIESAENLATKSELEDYAKIGDIAGFATESYVDDKVSSIDLSKYALKTDLTGLASESYVDQKLGIYATEEYVDSQIGAIPKPDLSDYLTIAQADDKYAQKQDLTAYATTEYVDDGIAKKADKSDLDDYLTITDSKSLATQEELNTAIESIDLSDYATTKYVDDEIARFGDIDLSGYATTDYVDDKISEIDLSEYRKLDNNEFSGVVQISCDDDGLGTGIFFFDQDEQTFRANIVANNAGLQFNQQFDGHLTSLLVPSDGSRGTIATREWCNDNLLKLITDLQKQNEELAEKVEFLTQRLSMSK